MIPFFPESKYLSNKRWHRFFKVFFIVWAICVLLWPLLLWRYDAGDCAKLATETYIYGTSVDGKRVSEMCQREYSPIQYFSGFFDLSIGEIFLVITLTVGGYLLPLGVYRVILYIVNDKWQDPKTPLPITKIA